MLTKLLLSLLTGLALVACSGGASGPVEPSASSAITRDSARAASGAKLAMRVWPANGRARAVILGLHGYGDAGELTFEAAARYWADRGITVYAYDQRGFGANPSRKQWPGAEALVSDAINVTATLRKRHASVPLVIVGHSMGGGVVLAAAAQGLQADGLVLAGPAITGGDALSLVYRTAAWGLAFTAPDKRWTGDGIVEILPSDNIDAMRLAALDPRPISAPSSRELYGLVRVMDLAAAAAPQVQIPTLTLMGAHDVILDPALVQSVHNTIPGAARFIYYPDGWHWLFRDLQAETVWRDTANFALSSAVRPQLRISASQ
jgi:acylglycerol lipase